MQIVRRATLIYQSIVALIIGGGTAFVGAVATPLGAWIGLVPIAFVIWFGLRRPIHRFLLSRRTFPESWRVWMLTHIPYYRHLDEHGRSLFERNVRFFVEEQRFEGVGGVEVSDELKLAVGAGAALLLHGRPDWEIPGQRTILFYEGVFDDTYRKTRDADFTGMVHPQGPIILAVNAVYDGWEDPRDGFNVVIHELAHLFDMGDETADGVPTLIDSSSLPAWDSLVRREMQRIRTGRSMLDEYGSVNRAEFFAVAVEQFFERPTRMKRQHPELFDALSAFFAIDPRFPD